MVYSNETVGEYYDKCGWHYRLFWTDNESLAMHYGFWEQDTTSKKEALINQYREIIEIMQPAPGEQVLDAGCGIGGASFWVAEKTGANVVGITISENQLKTANKLLNGRNKHLSENIGFEKRNYLNTGFAEKKFDKIFGIESFCYAYPHPEKLFREMHRILKDGGKLLVSDGICLRQAQNSEEKKMLEKFCCGFKLSGVNTAGEIIGALERCGFRNIKHINKTEQIKKNRNILYWRAVFIHPFLRLLGKLKLVAKVQSEHGYAPIFQKKLIEKGIMGYGIFYAEK